MPKKRPVFEFKGFSFLVPGGLQPPQKTKTRTATSTHRATLRQTDTSYHARHKRSSANRDSRRSPTDRHSPRDDPYHHRRHAHRPHSSPPPPHTPDSSHPRASSRREVPPSSGRRDAPTSPPAARRTAARAPTPAASRRSSAAPPTPRVPPDVPDQPDRRPGHAPSGYPGLSTAPPSAAERSARAVSPSAQRATRPIKSPRGSHPSHSSAVPDYPQGTHRSSSDSPDDGYGVPQAPAGGTRAVGGKEPVRVYDEYNGSFPEEFDEHEYPVKELPDTQRPRPPPRRKGSGKRGDDSELSPNSTYESEDTRYGRGSAKSGDRRSGIKGMLGFGDSETEGGNEVPEDNKFNKNTVVKAALIAAVVAALGFLVKKIFFSKKKKEEQKLQEEEKKKQKYKSSLGMMQEEGELEVNDADDLLSEDALLPDTPHSMFRVQVPQNEAFIIERGGKYHRKLNAGNNFLLPCVDQIAFRHSLKESSLPIPPQQCYTRDNVSVRVNGVLFIRVEDPVAASYGVENPYRSVMLLSQTAIRGELGKLSLDQTFEERHVLNERISTIINEAARPWGLRCTRFELKDIDPPEELRATMNREVEAARQKRADILASEAERQALINRAEGEMQAQMKLSQARQMEIVNQAIGEAHAIQERGEAIAGAMRDVAEVMKEPGGEQAMQLRLAEQYLHAYGKPPPSGMMLDPSGFNPLQFIQNVPQAQPPQPHALPPVHGAAIAPQLAPAVHPQHAPAVHPQHAPAVHPQHAPAVHPQHAPAVHAQHARAVHSQHARAVHPQQAPAMHPQHAPAPTFQQVPAAHFSQRPTHLNAPPIVPQYVGHAPPPPGMQL